MLRRFLTKSHRTTWRKRKIHWNTKKSNGWEGARLPRASGKFRDLPGSPPDFPVDFPGSSLTVELNSNPDVPQKFHRLPRKFPGLPRKFPGLPRKFPRPPPPPGGPPLSLGSLTPSPDSQTFSEISPSLGVSVAIPAEPRGEKNNFLLCKFGAVKNF